MNRRKFKCIIIDDEKLARDIVKNMLSNNSDIEIIAECENGFDGLKAIQELKPDIVFLDVQMPKITGFEMLELLDEIPEIIFTTAFDQYAIKAFEVNAIDYLLKPFSEERFKSALDKAIKKANSDSPHNLIKEKLSENVITSGEYLKRIVVKKIQKILVIPIEDIEYIEAQDDYVMFMTTQGKFMKKGTMNFYEKNLDPKVFSRIHRSYIIRIDLIKQIEPYGKDSYIIIVNKDLKLPLSKSKYQQLKNSIL
ncbi:MAG: response regulator [Ignavibacteriales bacterium]|nr:response regulator [Ignavibacteriales bacterium]